jgi:toxin ParE1/3/4
VPEVRYTALAEDDLDEIAAYTGRTWNVTQATRYIAALESCCEMLAESPERGRRCDSLSPGLWRFPQARHVVFYQQKSYGIRVVRVLHQKQLTELHEFEDDEPTE